METRSRLKTIIVLIFLLGLLAACSREIEEKLNRVDIYDEITLVQHVVARVRTGDFMGLAHVIKGYFQGEEIRMQRRISQRFSVGDHKGVVELVGRYMEEFTMSDENFNVLLFKASSHHRLNQLDKAIDSYEAAIPFIKKMNNVIRRRYGHVFFTLGYLYGSQGRQETGVSYIQEGLLLEPQNIYYQIYLGNLYKELGRNDAALQHYRELLGSSSARILEEEKVILKIKIRELSPEVPSLDFNPATMENKSLHKDFTIKILPINRYDSVVETHDICAFLESKFLLACQVLDPLELNEQVIMDVKRNQYDGDKVLDELTKHYPATLDRRHVIVALTGHDLFGKNTNYVFSWQNMSLGIGVVSSYRFVTGIDEFYEREIVATRRMGIQFISTIGSLLGFTRPTLPHCPDAYPQDFTEFLQKSSRLCSSTIAQRDKLLGTLQQLGRQFSSFDQKTKENINRVYKKYYFDYESE